MVPPNKSSSDSAPSTLNFVPKPNLGRQYVSEERYKQEKMAIGQFQTHLSSISLLTPMINILLGVPPEVVAWGPLDP